MALKTYTVTLNSVNPSTITNLQVPVRLSAANFDFANANANGDDTRFETTGAANLDYWIENWDNVAETAKIWVKVDSVPSGTSTIKLKSGDGSAAASNGAAVFEYFNALSSAGDLADLSSSFGTNAWSVVTDAASPTGFAVEGGHATTGEDTGRYKALALSGDYVAEINTAALAESWQGPLINMEDANSWYRGGARPTSLTGASQIRRNNNGALTNYGTDVTVGAQVTNDYFKQITRYQPKREVTSGTSFSVTTEIPVPQGICTDGSKIWATSSSAIARYSLAGTVEESTTNVPAGTSWGDCELKDGVLYIVRFNSTTSTAIYSFDPLNLASGFTLVATITADMHTGANALTWTGDYWIVGETDTSSVNLHVYIYNANWTLQKSVLTPRIQADGYGWQGATTVNNNIYMVDHEGVMGVFAFNSQTLTLDMVDRIDSTYSTAQSIAWDSVNNRFYLIERISDLVVYATISDHATEKTIWTHWDDDVRSVACPSFDAVTAAQNTQSQVGFGTYRKSRTANLFYRKQAIEPVATLAVITNNTPIADAGVDQTGIAAGATVTLDGTASSDADLDAITFSWTQTAGDAVTLSSATAAQPTFTAPSTGAQQTLTFSLVVNDGTVSSVADTVDITVNAVESTINITATSTPNGTYPTLIFSPTDYSVIHSGNVTFTAGAASIPTIPLAVGTAWRGVVFDNNATPIDGAALVGVTE